MELLLFPFYEAFWTCIASTQSPKAGNSTPCAQDNPNSAVTLMPVMQHRYHWIVELGKSALTAFFARRVRLVLACAFAFTYRNHRSHWFALFAGDPPMLWSNSINASPGVELVVRPFLETRLKTPGHRTRSQRCSLTSSGTTRRPSGTIIGAKTR